MKCSERGHWNRIPVGKKPHSPERKVRIMVFIYDPLEISKCEKCGENVAQPERNFYRSVKS